MYAVYVLLEMHLKAFNLISIKCVWLIDQRIKSRSDFTIINVDCSKILTIIRITLDLLNVNHFSVSLLFNFFFLLCPIWFIVIKKWFCPLPFYADKSLESCVLNVLSTEPDHSQQTHNNIRRSIFLLVWRVEMNTVPLWAHRLDKMISIKLALR